MGYALLVKPILLGALALVFWAVWRAGDRFEPAAARRHCRGVAVAGCAIGLLVVGPAVRKVLRDHPDAVLNAALVLSTAAALLWAYARLIGAAHRRAGRRHGGR